MNKLVISDRQWAAYAGRFGESLGGSWRVAAAVDGVENLRAELAGARALLGLAIPAEALEAAAGLEMFLFPGAGILEADPAHYPEGCAVVNVFEHGVAVAEYVMAAILMHVTGIAGYAASFRQGSWAGSGRTGGATHEEAFGKTIGLIGFGTIGQAVAQRALAFGMRVLAISDAAPAAPPPHFLGAPEDLPLLLRESDFLVIACPLTAQTRGMLGPRELACMKSRAVLINVSRAEIVAEEALYEALRARRLGGAALDVWYRYPESGEQILHGSALPFHELPQVIATPHMAGWTCAMVERRIARMVENLARLARGEAPERVVLVGRATVPASYPPATRP